MLLFCATIQSNYHVVYDHRMYLPLTIINPQFVTINFYYFILFFCITQFALATCFAVVTQAMHKCPFTLCIIISS
jgi:hypothetical protein